MKTSAISWQVCKMFGYLCWIQRENETKEQEGKNKVGGKKAKRGEDQEKHARDSRD